MTDVALTINLLDRKTQEVYIKTLTEEQKKRLLSEGMIEIEAKGLIYELDDDYFIEADKILIFLEDVEDYFDDDKYKIVKNFNSLIFEYKTFEKAQGYERKFISFEDLPKLQKTIKYGLKTNMGLIDYDKKIKYILEYHKAEMIDNVLEQELTAYVILKSGFRGRHYSKEIEDRLKSLKSPQFVRAGIYENHVLIDLKSAYWQITKKVGLDVYFDTEKFQSGTKFVDKRIEYSKIGRNAIVGVLSKTKVHRIKDGKMKLLNMMILFHVFFLKMRFKKVETYVYYLINCLQVII